MQALIAALMPARDVIPEAVVLVHRSAQTGRNEVEVRDRETGELVEVMPVPEAAAWLQQLHFEWLHGSNGIWRRAA
jgi:hypothetical protein